MRMLMLRSNIFVQQTLHHTPMVMSAKYSDLDRDDVLFDNLRIHSWEATVRQIVSWALTIGIIVAYLPLVAFVGTVSNISSLCSDVSWLSWICDLPDVIVSILQGALPPVSDLSSWRNDCLTTSQLALAILFMLIPIAYRLISRYVQGLPLLSLVNLSTFERYFLFLVVRVNCEFWLDG